LVLLIQLGQLLVEEQAVLGAAAMLAALAASEVLLVAAPAPRQAFTAAAIEQHRLCGEVHTSPAEVSACQVRRLDTTTVAVACLPPGRRELLAQLVGPQGRRSTELLRQIASRLELAQLPLQHVINQVA
jgi:hypothetical protein